MFQHTTINFHKTNLCVGPVNYYFPQKKKKKPKLVYVQIYRNKGLYIFLLALTEGTVSRQLITTAITDGQQIF